MTVVLGAACILAHTPDLVFAGSKAVREIRRCEGLYEQTLTHLRTYEQATAYPPNQVFIGNLRPDRLAELPKPWYSNPLAGARRQGPYGEIMPEDELYGLLKAADAFDLIWLEETFAAAVNEKLQAHPLLSELPALDSRKTLEEVRDKITNEDAVPLRIAGQVVGCARRAHSEDDTLKAGVLLEGLAAKATGFLALRHLLDITSTPVRDIEYLMGFGEEAIGDRYQRGGGNMAKAVGEMAGCINASGADVKAFCCAPIHSIVSAAALIQAGVFEKVVLLGGGSLAKLGMKFQFQVQKDIPILEDTLAGIAILLGEDDGVNPVVRTDAVGMHRICAGSSAKEIYDEVVVKPLVKLGRKITDIDKYATELHNPEATVTAGRPDTPLINYRALAAMAVMRGEMDRDQIDNFVRQHGMPGFSPTQGHIPSAIPFMPHARDMMLGGEMRSAMFVGKGSLFLGRMTDLSDGVSILVESQPSLKETNGERS